MKFPESSLSIGHIDPGKGVIAFASAQAKKWVGHRRGNRQVYAQFPPSPMEYEYDIDANTGAVLGYSQDAWD